MSQWGSRLRVLGAAGFLTLVSPLALAEAPVAKSIQMVSEQWTGYTNADGSGMAWDIMRKVFEPAGYQVITHVEPYTRAVGLVQRAEQDAWVGSYSDETQALLPRWNYDVDHVYALGLLTQPSPAPGTLGLYRLAWVRSYQYQRYLPGIKRYTQVLRRTGIIDMLDRGRFDYYIDALGEINELLAQSDRAGDFKITHVAELPLYVGFADTSKGRILRALFDERMDQLVPAGQLRAIFAKWQQPYPFDSPSAAERQ